MGRNPSFSKRVRKSIRSWASQKGLVDPCKVKAAEPGLVTQSQESTKPSSVVLSATECRDKIADVDLELDNKTSGDKIADGETSDELTKTQDKTEAVVELAQAEVNQEAVNKEEAVVKESSLEPEPGKEEVRDASEESFVIVEKEDV